MVNFTGLLENARPPPAGPGWGTLWLDPCKNWLPARIGGWPGTATGGQIHVVHISHTHPPKEIIQALRKYLLGKKKREADFCPARSAGFLNPLTRKIVFVRPASVRACVCTPFPYCDFATFHFLFGNRRNRRFSNKKCVASFRPTSY